MSTSTYTPAKRILLAFVVLAYVFSSHQILADSPVLQLAWLVLGCGLVYLLLMSARPTNGPGPKAQWRQRARERSVMDAVRVLPSLEMAEDV